MPNGTVYDLQPGARHRVKSDFTDFYGGQFKQGSILTFQKFNFVPYHGGYTIYFAEQTLYLQEDENASILQDMWAYLEPVG